MADRGERTAVALIVVVGPGTRPEEAVVVQRQETEAKLSSAILNYLWAYWRDLGTSTASGTLSVVAQITPSAREAPTTAFIQIVADEVGALLADALRVPGRIYPADNVDAAGNHFSVTLSFASHEGRRGKYNDTDRELKYSGGLNRAIPVPHLPSPNPVVETQPPLTMREEVEAAERDTAKLQQPVVERFQKLLDDLKGRKADLPDDDKWVARVVTRLAQQRGVELVDDKKVVDVRWHSRVFETRLLAAGKKTVSSSATFPSLTARISAGLDSR